MDLLVWKIISKPNLTDSWDFIYQNHTLNSTLQGTRKPLLLSLSDLPWCTLVLGEYTLVLEWSSSYCSSRFRSHSLITAVSLCHLSLSLFHLCFCPLINLYPFSQNEALFNEEEAWWLHSPLDRHHVAPLYRKIKPIQLNVSKWISHYGASWSAPRIRTA